MKKLFLLMAAIFLIPCSASSVAERTFEQYVAEGNMPGYWWIDKFALNNEITTATDPEDVWEYGGMYTFSSNAVFPDVGVADIVSCSSSSASDTQDIGLLGLGDDGYEKSVSLTLEGQTRVAISSPFWRLYRIENDADEGGGIVGTVYCYAGTENTDGVPSGASIVKAIVDDGNNQTQMSPYTIPRGKVGFLYRGEVGMLFEGGPGSGTDTAKIQYRSRRYGKVFKVKKTISLVTGGTTLYQDNRSFPDPIPALTDIKIVVQEVSATMGVWATLDILIVDQDRLNPGFLNAIGQPFQ